MDTLTELHDQIKVCQRCALSKGRTHAVPGVGPATAEIMLIGEAPGFHEDRQGLPFVGPAGKFLDELLGSAGIKREEVYIANVIKSRPPGNRDPLPEEIEACRSWLDAQIEIIKPKVIVTLGRFSMARWFPKASISRIHGQPKRIGGVIYVPMLHPAAALHQAQYRPLLIADFQKLPLMLEELREEQRQEEQRKQQSSSSTTGGQPQQLSLF